MSIKHGSNRFFPRAGDGGGVVPPGAGLWTLYGAAVVGLTDITETVAIGDTVMLSNEKLLVRGGITSGPSGAGSDAFLETGANDASVFSDANSIRIIFNGTSSQAEISTNGGAYLPIATGASSPWMTAAGVITEVTPTDLVVVGSAAALNANQLQVLGNSTLRAAVNSVATFAVENSSPVAIFQVDTVNNAAAVRGSFQMASGSTAEVYLESSASTAATAAAATGRIRYNNAVTPSWQGSVNAGPWFDFITSGTLPTIAFVQGGNAFGVPAVLGTTDGNALTFLTNNTEKARITTAGALLVGATAPVYGELFGVTQSVLGSATSKAAAVINATVTTADPGGMQGLRIDATSAVNAPSTAALVQGALFRSVATGTGSVSLIGLQSFAGAGPAATGVAITQAVGVAGPVGYDSTAISGAIASASCFQANHTGLGVGKTIGTVLGLQVSNLGTANVNYAIGVDISAQTGALIANLGIRSLSPVVIGVSTALASESLRVSGGGALVDGSIFTVLATGAVSINSSGAAINIGDAANAFAVNVGTGAANRNVTLGSTTGTSQTVVNAGTGGILIGTSASNRTISIGTAAANQQINVGSITGTSSLNFFYGSAGFTTTQANATTGTPVGFAYTAGTHVGLTVAEALDVNFNLSRTVTFGGGGTIALQRAASIGGPTYAAPAPLTLTQVATLSVGLPIAGGNVTFTSGANVPTLPTDSGAAGGAYALSVAPGVRIQGDTANATVSVSLLIKNTASNATALPSIGWLSNGGTLDGVMGVQTGNAFNHQRFVLMLRANGTLSPALSISSQGGYRLTNSAPADPGTTPAGFLFTGTANGAVNTYAATVEASQFTVNSAQTYTFNTGTIAVQRSALFQAPTYAFALPSTITDAATVAVTDAPIAGASAAITRSMAIWVQAGVSRFDGGVGVKVTPGGSSVQGLAADFYKTTDPGLVVYAVGISTVQQYGPATGYLSILPARWTLPAASAFGLAVYAGIRFTWSDNTTTDRFNTTMVALTETRDSLDFNKDGFTIVRLSFIVNNTTGAPAGFDFGAWTTDGNQF